MAAAERYAALGAPSAFGIQNALANTTSLFAARRWHVDGDERRFHRRGGASGAETQRP